MTLVTHDPGFCERFGYPEKVQEQIKTIVNLIDLPQVVSVLLVGSTSRGELSCSKSETGLDIYSDYEFLLVTGKKADPERVAELRRGVRELEKQFSPGNPLFHIDLSLVNLRSLRKLPRIIRNYEARETGKTLFGEDLRDKIPEVTVANLDFKELNEVFLWRLWSIMLYCPESFLSGRLAATEEHIFSYVLCRNGLDLTTWLLPWEGRLIPCFKGRVERICRDFPNLTASRFFDNGFPAYLEECVEGKFDQKFRTSALSLYERTITYFLQARSYLFFLNGMESEHESADRTMAERSALVYNERNLRRKAFEALVVSSKFKTAGMAQSAQWLLRRKHGLMFNLLYNIHLTLLAHLTKGQAEGFIGRAESAMEKLSLGASHREPTGAFQARWLRVRRDYADFLMEYYRSVNDKREYICSVLDWTRGQVADNISG